jgi:MFS family permease
VTTLLGWTGPWLLLGLTFAIGLGNALNAPAWQATTPELVPREELTPAIALSGVSVNVARAVGPAVGGLIVAATGPGWVFLLNSASFLAVIYVLGRWRYEPVSSSTLPAEDVPGAMRAGMRYVRHSAAFRAVMARTAAFVIPASALWALLPLFARQHLGLTATGYGVMLGCLGTGAIAGAVVLPRIRSHVTSDQLVLFATFVFGAVSAVLPFLEDARLAGAALVVGGGAWISAMSTLNVSAQSALPAWVRARGLASGLLVLQGGLALGSLCWGIVATQAGIGAALVGGAVCLLVGVVLSRKHALHGLSNLNLKADPRWTLPQTACELAGDEGPVLVTLEYRVPDENADAFLVEARKLERIRRRDGAIRWNVYRDVGDRERWVETFVVESWLEHLRQHERGTADDRVLLDAVKAFHRGDSPPLVRHHIAGRRS